MTDAQPKWDEEADVVVIGYGFAGATAAISAYDSGADVLLLEKAPELHKGGNSRVSANLVFGQTKSRRRRPTLWRSRAHTPTT